MHSWGLFLLGLGQIGNAILIYFFSHKASLLGAFRLPVNLSVYKHLLAALWLSVGIVYLVGSWNMRIMPGAVLLALLNAFLEIVGYWKSGLPKVYAVPAAIIMGLLAAWSAYAL